MNEIENTPKHTHTTIDVKFDTRDKFRDFCHRKKINYDKAINMFMEQYSSMEFILEVVKKLTIRTETTIKNGKIETTILKIEQEE